MIQVTNGKVAEFYYCSEQDDYFYKESGLRVPDELRKGFNTTVFRKSDQNQNAVSTPTSVLNEKIARLGIVVS